MAVKRGLNMGRGLEALFPQRAASAEPAEGANPAGAAESEAAAAKEAPSKAAAKASPGNSTKRAGASGRAAKAPAKKSPENAPSTASQTKVQETDNNITSTDSIRRIRLAEIAPNAAQPRKDFDEEAIDELAASIRDFGVLQPLLVQKKGDFYEIIAGERRWRAAKRAGLKELPVLVRDYTDRETFEISLIENLQRESLNAIEEAQAYQRLVEEFGLTQEAVAARVSKSRTAVTNALRLLKLTPEVQAMLIAGDLSMGHARALLGLPAAEMQLLAAEQVAKGALSVRDTEKLVKRLLNPPQKRERRTDAALESAYRSIEDRLRKMTGSKARIQPGRGQTGRIEIEYYSYEDLERIVALIG